MNDIKIELPEWHTELTAICLTDTVSLLTEIKIRTLIEQKLKEAECRYREKTLLIVSEIQNIAMRYNTVVSTEAIHLQIKEIVLKHLSELKGDVE
jgi:hypothetical protein